MERETGIAVLNLPATRLFKIRVDFRMNKDGDAAGENA